MTRATKQRAYRLRMQRAGRCPHCGKPCLPYAECAERRFYKRLSALLRRMVTYGRLRKTAEGYSIADRNARPQRGHYKTDPGGQAPRGFMTFAQTYLRALGRPASADEIAAAFTEHKPADRAGRG